MIKDEHETQDRNILLRKTALDSVISELGKVLLSGVIKADERGSSEGADASPRVQTMEVDETEAESEPGKDESKTLNPSAKPFASQMVSHLHASGQQLRTQSSASLSRLMMTPSMSRENTPSFTPVAGLESRPESPAIGTPQPHNEGSEQVEEAEEGEDIEMGEVDEAKNERAEDREEGEASDSSSILSEPPDEQS